MLKSTKQLGKLTEIQSRFGILVWGALLHWIIINLLTWIL